MDNQKIKKPKKWKKILTPYLFILPFLFTYAVFFAYPAIYSFLLSFFRYKGYGKMTFVGFNNYLSLFKYSFFWTSLKNTVFYFAAHFIPVMLTAFLFALAMHSRLLMKVQSFFKPILFMPQIIPTVATALVFKIMFSTNTGAINQAFGLNVKWLEEPSILKWPVVFMIIWRSIGWYMVIFMAGLTTVSDDLTDAAKIDGAGYWQTVTKITIPVMRPIFLFAFVTDAISSFKIYTEPNILLTTRGRGSAAPEAQPFMNLITNNIRGGNFGSASAAGWLLFLIILLISLVQLKLMRGDGTE